MNAALHTADLLDELLQNGHVLILSKDDDGFFHGSTDGKHSVALNKEGMLEQLTPNPRVKVCLRADCDSKGKPKSIHAFGPDPDSADGHSGTCRACEARRVTGRAKKKRAASNGLPLDHQDKPGEAGGGIEAVVDPHVSERGQDVDG